ncbi:MULTISPECIES: hypothetical protein [unclassified Pseudomonas]|uniref:hypothetical protein n=1 Tax=unclassified Pseudomonas TaxID=196821 RepID=UPI00131CB035|nr:MULTISPECIES: hypothetical protein [unclassified Pseudomonas]
MTTARQEKLRQDTNRVRFRQLLDAHSIKQGRAAEMIEFRTKSPCSIRTVRAWLADPEAKTALPCPDHALAALEHMISTIQRYNAQREMEEQTKQNHSITKV